MMILHQNKVGMDKYLITRNNTESGLGIYLTTNEVA